jgi:nitrogen fixation protein
MVVKKEGGFTYPGVVFEKSAVMGVAPFAPVFITDSTENWGGSWLLLSNGQRMHINEGLQHVLEIFNIDETVIEKYMDRQDDAPFLL